MRKLIASTFVSLDGIMQAPGAPKACCFAHIDDVRLEQLDPAPRRCNLGNHHSQDSAGPGPADYWQRQFDSNAAGLITYRRVQRVDFSSGAWAG